MSKSYELKIPLVSICIPLFNGENFINDSINSVLLQDYENFELIIIDNCSTDKSIEKVKLFKDKRIRLIQNKYNIGAFKNFQKCVDEAVGEYFVLLPHDDYLLPGFIKNYVSKLNNKNIGMVYSSVKIVDITKSLLTTRLTYKTDNLFSNYEAIVELFEKFNPIQLTMVRTNIIRKVGSFDGKYGLFIDAHLWLKIMLDGWSVFYYSKPYTCHRSHDTQGQNAFMNLDLEILSEHWGKKLDKEFWLENSYNYFFLKFMNYTLEKTQSEKDLYITIKNILLKIFIRTHIRFIIISILKFNYFILKHELSLFKRLLQMYALKEIINQYFIMILKLIYERIIRILFRIKIFSKL